MNKQAVEVFSRKVTADEYTIWFQSPPEISQTEWVDRGFGIDGNFVIITVTDRAYVRDGKIRPRVSGDEPQSPIEARMDVEGSIAERLGQAGRDVEFK